MEYEVYRHKDATDEEFTYISDMFKNILKEDKDLCNAAQKNLNGSVFINGELHPHAEKVSPMRTAGHACTTDMRSLKRALCISRRSLEISLRDIATKKRNWEETSGLQLHNTTWRK